MFKVYMLAMVILTCLLSPTQSIEIIEAAVRQSQTCICEGQADVDIVWEWMEDELDKEFSNARTMDTALADAVQRRNLRKLNVCQVEWCELSPSNMELCIIARTYCEPETSTQALK